MMKAYRDPRCMGTAFTATDDSFWPIATGHILTANRRFRGIADMDRFSSRNDL
jgi:hypothetical protein